MQGCHPQRGARAVAFVLAAAILGSGCRSAPPPIEQLVVARMAIDEAVDAGAMEQAAAELASARQKLERARNLAANKESERARILAEEAELDARVAAAKARRARAQGELSRVEGGTPSSPPSPTAAATR